MTEDEAIQEIVQNLVNELIVCEEQKDAMAETIRMCKIEMTQKNAKNYAYGYADGMARAIYLILTGQLDISMIKKTF